MTIFMQFVERRAAKRLWFQEERRRWADKVRTVVAPEVGQTDDAAEDQAVLVHKPCEGSLDQLHWSVDALGKLEIGLLPPKKEALKRLIDKQKN